MIRMLARVRRVVRTAVPASDSGEEVYMIRMLDGLEASVASASFRPEDLDPFMDEVLLCCFHQINGIVSP
jgi:hypothetical protein